ncbi:MAG: MFS transporter [wastewater metagenome]|nr:MFS transporter [Candidatus Loosdrechtia aerotolerans]
MLKLLRKYPHLLLFGLLTAAFSGPGQTFLVSLFIGPMRETFGYSQSGIASIYSVATLVSAGILPFHGRLLDRVRLVWFTLAAGFLLATGCFLLSWSQGFIMIFFGFLLVRNLGQGTLTMISSTTMARSFGSVRGKALGIANMGYPLSEAVFPILISSWILNYGWRSGWIFLTMLILLFFLPVVAFLLRKDREKKVYRIFSRKSGIDTVRKNNAYGKVVTDNFDWRVRDILRDWRYYTLQIPILITPAFLTALFFHQTSLVTWKGWSIQTVSAAFIAFAVSRGVISFMIGPLIDRFTARALFPFVLIPLGLGILCFMKGNDIFWAFVYLGGAGLSMGLNMTIIGALWAELYGVKYLGSIKGLQSAIVVFSTAVTPLLFGILLDKNVNPQVILWGMILIILLGTGLSVLVFYKKTVPS